MVLRLVIETEVNSTDTEWVRKLLDEKVNSILISEENFRQSEKGIGQKYNDDLKLPFEIINLNMD